MIEATTPALEPQATSANDATPMRLVVQELRDGDLVRLATFLRTGGNGRLHGRWQLVFEGEADLILVGDADPCTVRGMLEAPAAIVRVVDAPLSNATEAALVRPIDCEGLMDLLLETERFRGVSATEPARTVIAPDLPLPLEAHLCQTRSPSESPHGTYP
jgi:hypothetical protein